jgi:putative serine protease PepD
VINQAAAVPGSAIVDGTGAVIAMITGDGTNSHGTRAWMLEQVAVDLIASGDTSHNWLGLVVSDEPGANIVVVDHVTNDSPAAQAGVRVGDLIDSFDGNPIVDAASLHHQVQRANPGDDAVLTVTRNNQRHIIIATLALAP